MAAIYPIITISTGNSIIPAQTRNNVIPASDFVWTSITADQIVIVCLGDRILRAPGLAQSRQGNI